MGRYIYVGTTTVVRERSRPRFIPLRGSTSILSSTKLQGFVTNMSTELMLKNRPSLHRALGEHSCDQYIFFSNKPISNYSL